MTRNKLPLLFLFCFLSAFAGAQDRPVVTPAVATTIKFTENLGQWKNTILLRALLPGGAMFVEENAMAFSFFDQQKMARMHHGSLAKGIDKDFVIKGHFYRVKFLGANPHPTLEKQQKGEDYENFFLDNDKDNWKSNVRNYKQVFLRGIYQGIDYELQASAASAKYNFHVAAGSDPSQIKMQYDGVNQLKISNGKLRVTTSVNEVVEQRPYAWQDINGEIVEVPCQFKLTDNTVTFVFPKGYNNKYALVIDPVLVFSAQIGSPADNFGMTATFDPQGNLYSAGTVYAPAYPTTTGAFDNSFNNQQEYGRTDVFVTKYAANGKSLIFSTYIGGSSTEVCSSLIVDKQGDLCMYGATGSSNFPMNGTGADKTFNGGSNIGFITNGSVFFSGTDIYVCKFNSTGTTLLASTYFGGSDNDGINYLGAIFPYSNQALSQSTFISNYDSLMSNYGDQYRGEIQLDSLGNIYICSSTRSSNIPIVMGFDNNLGGKQDAVVIKYNPSLGNVLFSTYLGGSYIDCGNAIFVTPDAQIYATGGTSSSDFPGTSGAHSPTYNGGKTDGYVSKIAANGTLVRTTFIGTSSYDNSFFVSCDKFGDVYVYGQSLGNMPVQTVAPSVPIYSVANTHQFISCYNNGLTARKMSTVFGAKLNALDISPSAFAIDECNGNIYLSGWGGSLLSNTNAMSGMPLLNPTQSTTNGYDFYLMALKPHATGLLYGSYFGGGSSYEHVDGGTSRFDRKGIIYQSVCAGCAYPGATPNQDFPISPGAWPCPNNTNCPTPNASGNCNNGVFKINFDLQQAVAKIITQNTVGCAPLTVTLTNSIPGTSYEWNLGAWGITSVVASPVVSFTAPGVYTVSLFVRDTTMCIREDTEVKTFSVFAIPQPSMIVNSSPCTNTVYVNATLNSNETFLNWNFGNNATGSVIAMTYTYPVDGIYTVSLSVTNSSYGCKASKTATVSVLQFNPSAAGGGSLCSGKSMQFTSSGGTDYSWSPGDGLNSASVADPVATPSISTIYSLTISKSGFGQVCTAQYTLGIDVKPSPTADYSYTVHPCGGSVRFEDQSYADIVKWFWQFSSGDTMSKASPLYYYEIGGVNAATLTTTNKYGCVSSVAKSFGVAQASVNVSKARNICKGQNTELQASGGYEYQWLPEESVQQPYLSTTVVTPTTTTEYTVIIGTNVTNSVTGGLCEYTLTTIVSVSELSAFLPINASAQPSVLIAGNSTQLVYVGDPGASVTWFPQNSTTPGTGYTVSASPQVPTTYTVVAKRDACVKAITVDVIVYSNKCLGKEVFVPNTFTPNGDGHNDLFKVHGLSVDQVYFAVYNRWGEKVYETNDKMGGWDGRYQSKDADVGVFGWYLKVKCFNGEETFMKGNVTLIR